MKVSHHERVFRRLRTRVGFVYSELNECSRGELELQNSDCERIANELQTLSGQLKALTLSDAQQA